MTRFTFISTRGIFLITALTAVISDITGFRKPISYARNIVWDRGEKLYTSIFEPTPDGRRMGVGDWGIVPSRQAGPGRVTKASRWKCWCILATTR